MVFDLHTPSLNQLVLAKFITEDHLERHIMKMKNSIKIEETSLSSN